MSMKEQSRIVVVGGVAAGATAATRARRLDEAADIVLVEKGPYVAYANCGLPYFIGGDIADRAALFLQAPAWFWARYRVKVLLRTEVVEIDRKAKKVRIRGPEGESYLAYDKLILAQGASPLLPNLPGSDGPGVFRLWTVPDMDRLHEHLQQQRPKSAVIVGGGFVGLEMAEALRKRGLDTTVVELLPTVLPNMDPEFGRSVGRELESNGVQVVAGAQVSAFLPSEGAVVLSDSRRLPADIVLFSVGARPELALARSAGLEVGPSGGLLVDEHLRTSDPDIYAAGDMVEIVHRVSGRKVRIPLAGPANRQGRIAASNAVGVAMRYPGALGSSVVKIFEATVAMTGLTERAAREAGLDVGVAVVHKDDRASYYPGAKELSLKLVYRRGDGRLLGAQAFGRAGVEKRIDVLATALAGRMSLADLAELDLAYAPPYSSANDPINMAAFVGLNDISGASPIATASELKAALGSGDALLVIDLRASDAYGESHLRGAVNIPVDRLRSRCEALPRDRPIYVHCRVGWNGHIATRMLRQRGFPKVVNVTGGYLSILAEEGFDLVSS